jgi:hypothetical protein
VFYFFGSDNKFFSLLNQFICDTHCLRFPTIYILSKFVSRISRYDLVKLSSQVNSSENKLTVLLISGTNVSIFNTLNLFQHLLHRNTFPTVYNLHNFFSESSSYGLCKIVTQPLSIKSMDKCEPLISNSFFLLCKFKFLVIKFIPHAWDYLSFNSI